VAPLSVYWINHLSAADHDPLQIILPAGPGNWSVTTTSEDGWTPQYHGAIGHKVTFKDNNNRQIYLYLGFYSAQQQGAELINDLNRISDNKIWRTKHKQAKLYNTGRQQVFEQLLVNKDGSHRLVWYWYRVAGYNAVNKYQAKALQVLGLLQGKRRASVVAISSQLDSDVENTRKILGQFVSDLAGTIGGMIDNEITRFDYYMQLNAVFMPISTKIPEQLVVFTL
jgi:EpsI family protein